MKTWGQWLEATAARKGLTRSTLAERLECAEDQVQELFDSTYPADVAKADVLAVCTAIGMEYADYWHAWRHAGLAKGDGQQVADRVPDRLPVEGRCWGVLADKLAAPRIDGRQVISVFVTHPTTIPIDHPRPAPRVHATLSVDCQSAIVLTPEWEVC